MALSPVIPMRMQALLPVDGHIELRKHQVNRTGNRNNYATGKQQPHRFTVVWATLSD